MDPMQSAGWGADSDPEFVRYRNETIEYIRECRAQHVAEIGQHQQIIERIDAEIQAREQEK